MARIRTIKPEFFNHEGLADVEPFARLLFVGLWCYADRAGRLKLQPKRLKVQILPYDSVSVNPLLDQLEGIGVLSRYEVGGQWYIWIPGFRRNQVFKNENPSVLPRHPEDTETDWQPDTERKSNPVVSEDWDNGNPAMGEDSPSDKPRKGKERKGKELGSSNSEGSSSSEKFVDIRESSPKPPDGGTNGKSSNRKPKRPVDPNWKLPPELIDYARGKNPSATDADIQAFHEHFISRCIAHDYRYAAFNAAWQDWYRKELSEGTLPHANGNGAAPVPSLPDPDVLLRRQMEADERRRQEQARIARGER